MNDFAFQHGFDRQDGYYIYSPYEDSPLYRGIAMIGSYFVDGIIDIGKYLFFKFRVEREMHTWGY